MSILKIERTEDTPEVYFDGESGELFMAGISFPDNVERFFTPVMMWLDEYINNPAPVTNVVFKFKYFNTSSSKKIYEILCFLDKLKSKGNEISIKWLYSEEDEDIRAAGIRYANMINFVFDFESY